jgi:hypothetical protein
MNENQSTNVNKEATSKGIQEPEKESSYAPEFDDWIKEKPKRPYIRLKNPNDSVIIRLKSGRPYKSRMDDFGGKAANKVPVYTYAVTTPDKPNEEQDFDVTSKRLGADILAYYEKGFVELEITRLDTNLVSYRVIPMIARQQQQQQLMTKRQQ